MAERTTRNVSLPAYQAEFIDDLVTTGRYRTASEVVRDGLRLLQASEHRRLLEEWIYRGLSADDEERLPLEVRERARAYFTGLIDQATSEVADGAVTDGPTAMRRLREKLAKRVE